MIEISNETAELCLSILAQVQLSANDPDLEQKVGKVIRARTELTSTSLKSINTSVN